MTSILHEPAFKEREVDRKGYDLIAGDGRELARHIRQELGTRAGPIRYSGAEVD